MAWRFRGTAAADGGGRPQTLVATVPEGTALPAVWVGLTGTAQRLTVTIGPEPGRSPHYWFGPELGPGAALDLQVAIHLGMGPGGVLWRAGDRSPWSSLTSSSPWGPERLRWPSRWSVGGGPGRPSAPPFRGRDLAVAHTVIEPDG